MSEVRWMCMPFRVVFHLLHLILQFQRPTTTPAHSPTPSQKGVEAEWVHPAATGAKLDTRLVQPPVQPGDPSAATASAPTTGKRCAGQRSNPRRSQGMMRPAKLTALQHRRQLSHYHHSQRLYFVDHMGNLRPFQAELDTGSFCTIISQYYHS